MQFSKQEIQWRNLVSVLDAIAPPSRKNLLFSVEYENSKSRLYVVK